MKMTLDFGIFEMPHPKDETKISHVPYLQFNCEDGVIQEFPFMAEFGFDSYDEAKEMLEFFSEAILASAPKVTTFNNDLN